MAIAAFVYAVGVLRYIHYLDRFERLEIAHFLGLGGGVTSCVAYLILHFIPKKHYRLLYFLTAVIIFSVIFVGHSMGVTGPTVDDCNSDVDTTARNLGRGAGTVVGSIPLNGASAAPTETSQAPQPNGPALGNLGQRLDDCGDQTIIFAGAVMLEFFFFLAMFDVQRLLLLRVKAKTYGERIVEMGI